MAKLLRDPDVRRLKADQELADTRQPGLRIRCYPSGTKTWTYRYRLPKLDENGQPVRGADGKVVYLQRKMRLGHYPAMSLKDARDECRRQARIREEHGDPRAVRNKRRDEKLEAQRREAAEAAERELTLESLTTAYLRYASTPGSKGFKKSWKKDQQHFDNYVLKYLGRKKPANDVTRSDVEDLLDRIDGAGKLTTATRVYAALRRCYNWGMWEAREFRDKDGKPLLTQTPCVKITRPAYEPADNYLDDDQIQTLMTGLDGSGIPADTLRALQSQLLTGLRIGEVVSATKGDFRREGGMLIYYIPAERSKNGRPHRAIVTHATPLLEALASTKKATSPLFPRSGASGHLRVDAVTKELRKALETLGARAWTSHSLRHSAVTLLARLGTPKEVRDRITNHIDRSVDTFYQHHDFDQEADEALAKLAAYIKGVTDGRMESLG